MRIPLIKKDDDVDRDLTGGAGFPLSKNERKLKKAMTGVFTEQLAQAGRLDVVNTLQFDWVASQSWAEEIYDLTHELIGVEFEVAGIPAAEQVGVKMTDFIERPQVQDAIREHTFTFAERTGQQTAKNLQQTLLIGTEKGEDLRQLRERVKRAFGFGPEDNHRADAIARTESKRANTGGEIIAWKETGVVVAKEWDAKSDACPFCLEMDGQVVALDQPFWNEGDELTVEFEDREITLPFNYLPVAGPPLHPHCRCDLKPVLYDIES